MQYADYNDLLSQVKRVDRYSSVPKSARELAVEITMSKAWIKDPSHHFKYGKKENGKTIQLSVNTTLKDRESLIVISIFKYKEEECYESKMILYYPYQYLSVRDELVRRRALNDVFNGGDFD